MLDRCLSCIIDVVVALIVQSYILPRYLVILDASIATAHHSDLCRSVYSPLHDRIQRPVKFSVSGISGITYLSAPNLLARFRSLANTKTLSGNHWSVHSVSWAGSPYQKLCESTKNERDRVRAGRSRSQARIHTPASQIPLGSLSHMSLVRLHPDFNLRIDCLGKFVIREKTMSSVARYDFQLSAFLGWANSPTRSLLHSS